MIFHNSDREKNLSLVEELCFTKKKKEYMVNVSTVFHLQWQKLCRAALHNAFIKKNVWEITRYAS